MDFHNYKLKIQRTWPWAGGLLAFFWILLRSGTNPKRLAYPCQQAAMPVAFGWILAVIAFFTGSILLRKFTKYSSVGILAIGAIWLAATLAEPTRSEVSALGSLPVWEVTDPVSTVYVLDSIPPTSGSLAAGDASVPDEHLVDPAMDTLLAMMEIGDVFLHQTVEHPDGVVGTDNVVVIKGNFQWTSRNTTSTDRVKGLIWRILGHPAGFTGEILICDNTQDIGTGIGHNDNNSEDASQSILDVINTFVAKGYPVYYLDWNSIWDDVAIEYSLGNYSDGYVYEEATKITYPKFRSPSGDYYISLRYGIWDSTAVLYDASRLCIINFPVLKAHGWAGATIAVKNWIGVLTTAHSTERFGGFANMHNSYFFGQYALVARVMAVTYPRLTIVDAAWITTDGPANLTWIQQADMLAASTDPAAASWYTAKYMLTPVARFPLSTNPDLPGSTYRLNLKPWAEFLADSAGYDCTMDSSEITVYDRSVLPSSDLTQPTVVVTSPSSGGIYTTLPTLGIDFSDNVGLDRGYYQLDACSGAWTEFWSYNSGVTDTSISWPVPSVSAGSHTVYFEVTDDAGNANGDTCTYAWSFTYRDYVCGDADGSSEVDIDDVVYLIAYIFSGGPAPVPYDSGDANCSGGVDIDDVVWLIAYVFSGGNAPCDTDGDGIPDC